MTTKKLGHLTVDKFLHDYWQQRPVVLKSALPDFQDLLSPEELAGLALDEDVESRIIQYLPEQSRWAFYPGPQKEDTFLNLPESHWTLLVQSLDYHLPEAAELMNQFNFIPGWRREDLMVSYAAAHGGVGPHVDQYDVFLIQGMGRRHWRVGSVDTTTQDYFPHPLLRQVAPFESVLDATLEQGDILYIPPGAPHDGTALEACLTYSVGFRAPSKPMILERLIDQLAQQDETAAPRYKDTDPTKEFQSERLPDTLLPWLRSCLAEVTDQQLLQSFGQLVTEQKYPTEPIAVEPAETLERLKSSNFRLALDELCRVSYTLHQHRLLLFINGQCAEFSSQHQKVIDYLCQNRQICSNKLINSLQDIEFVSEIANLINNGWINFTQH